ncbi:hypothetical protein [Streptomyces scabiei]|uniref:hypothetical protein n=1 Tax=Streptomyces scabiei TaxID=1930 RepID=UPI000765F289|nr:hypothetical protein [Streptomyces scabiei]
MSAAHLHAVPDPEDVPASAPAGVATAPGEGAAVVELLDAVPAPTAPPEDVEEVQAAEAADELEDAEEPGEYPDEEESGEEDVPPRAFALPDLRPYVTADRETARELRSLAADVTRTTAPRVRRGLAPVVRGLWKIIRAGAVVVLLALRAWFSGELAPKVPPLWRIILGPLITCAAVFQTVVLYPWAPLLLVPAWPLLALIVQRWASVQADRAAKAKASGKGGKGAAKASAKASPETFAARLIAALAQPPAQRSPEVPEEAAAEPAEDSPAEPPAELDGEGAEEAGGEPEETPVQEAPPAPSRDDLVRALHALVGGSSGVLDTALRDRLRYPSTRAVREALESADIPHRDGVRAVGGNGPGVHRRDFPPLPPPQEGAPGSGVVAGQDANNNANNTGEGPGEGLAVEGSEPGRTYPFDTVPDPERGPTAWKIIHRD